MADNESKNDYDQIAADIDDVLHALLGNAHEPPENFESDSLTILKDGFLSGIIRLQRLQDRVEGLADAHRA